MDEKRPTSEKRKIPSNTGDGSRRTRAAGTDRPETDSDSVRARRAAGERVVRSRRVSEDRAAQAAGERRRSAAGVRTEAAARQRNAEKAGGEGRTARAARPQRSDRSPSEETARMSRRERMEAAQRAEKRRRASRGYDEWEDNLYEEPKKKGRILGKVLVGLLFVIVIAGLLGGSFLWTMYGPTDEQYDLDTYYEVTADGQTGITVNNMVLVGQHGLQENGKVYVSYALVQGFLNDRFYWDPNENLLLYTLPAETVCVEEGSTECTGITGTQSRDYVIWKRAEDTAYIALDYVQEQTDMEFTLYEDGGTPRVMITTEWGETRTAEAKRDTQVRYRGGFKSPVLRELKKGEKLVVLDDVDDWKEVRTEDGLLGYVYGRMLTGEKTETLASSGGYQAPEYTSIHKDYKINLGWHQVTSQIANGGLQETLAKTSGLNTISPTWFSIADNSGNLNSIATQEYVDYAHQQGIEVWALVDNFNSEIDQMEVFGHTSARRNLVGQLVEEALQYGIDGINVDFEQIPQDVGDHYIQFIRELSVACRQNNLVLSVDNYVPMGYNAHYHRPEQGVMADYFVIMGYDEHYGGSPEAGSVASYDYVKGGIEVALQDGVPAEKIVSGIPFYTRIWREVPKTEAELAEQEGTDAANYTMKVTSEAMGMDAAAGQVSAAGADLIWDDSLRQNYAEWSGSDGATYRVWLEDSASLEAKLSLIPEYGLAGSAAWKLGFETSDVWPLISKYVN